MIKYLSRAVWGVAALVMIAVVDLPLGAEAQLAATGAALAAMMLIKMARLGGPWRSVFLGLGTFVVLRYMHWRLTCTLPPINAPLDFAAGLLLVIAECYCVIMLFLSLFTVAQPIDRPRAPLLSDADAPTVDVFVPSYNESMAIVAPTLAAAKRMRYPADKLNVVLLDDGSTDQKLRSSDPGAAAQALLRQRSLQSLCAELGVRYMTRAANLHAKAGNLNHGLANSEGDLVVVFDADHVPGREFLQETVGFFKNDEKLFLVQTPHFFLNPDPIEKNLSAGRMPAENDMFYSLGQKGLDKWNATFFCGSAAVLRREALDQVGGFQGSSITEDAETALELHSRGWNSLYVETPMIAGLQPETFDAFITQRSRWCRGMVQILLLKNPLFKSGLTLAQRLSYLSSGMFWLFPLSRMAFIFAPILSIFFGVRLYVATQQDFIAYTMTYMLSTLLIQNYIFSRFRWPWISDAYEYIQSVMLFRAVISVFIDPRNPKFEVTAKGQTLDEHRVSAIALPYFAIFVLVAASLAMLGWRFMTEPTGRDILGVVGVWTVLNLVLTGLGLGAVCELRERRSVPRIDSRVDAILKIEATETPLVIEDMSLGGLRVRVPPTLHLAAHTTGMLRMRDAASPSGFLETPVISTGRRTLLSRRGLSRRSLNDDGRSVGLSFCGINGDRFRIVAAVAFADVALIHSKRRSAALHVGLARGSAIIALWCLSQTGRGLYCGLFQRGRTMPDPAPAVTSPIESLSA